MCRGGESPTQGEIPRQFFEKKTRNNNDNDNDNYNDNNYNNNVSSESKSNVNRHSMYIQATGNAGNKRRQKQHTKREEKKER